MEHGSKENRILNPVPSKNPGSLQEDGKGVRLLDLFFALVSCKDKLVLLKKSDTYIDGNPSSHSQFRKIIQSGEVIKIEAVLLDDRHGSGAQYKATRAWIGKPPPVVLPCMLKGKGKGSVMLDHNTAIVFSDNKSVLVKRSSMFLDGRSVSFRQFKRVITGGSIICLELLNRKQSKLYNGISYDCEAACAWVGKRPEPLSQEERQNLEAVVGIATMLLNHNVALVACNGKMVIVKRSVVFYHHGPCSESVFKKLPTDKQPLRINAVPLSVPHSTGAQYEATCAWIGPKPHCTATKQTPSLQKETSDSPVVLNREDTKQGKIASKNDMSEEAKFCSSTKNDCSEEALKMSPLQVEKDYHPANTAHPPKAALKKNIFVVQNKPVLHKSQKLCFNNNGTDCEPVEQTHPSNFSSSEKVPENNNLDAQDIVLPHVDENATTVKQSTSEKGKEVLDSQVNPITNGSEGTSSVDFPLVSGIAKCASEKKCEAFDHKKGCIAPAVFCTSQLEETCGIVKAHVSDSEGIIEVEILGYEVRFSADHIVSWDKDSNSQRSLSCTPLGSLVMFSAVREPGDSIFQALKVWVPFHHSA